MNAAPIIVATQPLTAQEALDELCSYLYSLDAVDILRNVQNEVNDGGDPATVLCKWIGIVASRVTGLFVEAEIQW